MVDKCYCDIKHQKSLVFNKLLNKCEPDTQAMLTREYNAILNDLCKENDIGLGINFCSIRCIIDFVEDYFAALKNLDARVSNYEIRFHEDFYWFGRPTILYLNILDHNGKIISRLISHGNANGYNHFDNNIIKKLMEKETCYESLLLRS